MANNNNKNKDQINNKSSSVVKFTDAVRSIPDSPQNGPLNAIDLYENTRFST